MRYCAGYAVGQIFSVVDCLHYGCEYCPIIAKIQFGFNDDLAISAKITFISKFFISKFF